MLDIVKLAFIGLVTIPTAIVVIVLGLLDAEGKMVYRIGRFWTWLILRVGGITLKVEGLNHLDSARPYVFMVNHQSNIDIPVLIQAIRGFQLRWIAKKELLWIPFFGWAMWASKHILVDRADRRNALTGLNKAKDRIRAGISIVVFPEGTRSRDGSLMRFKKGGVLIAAQTGVPIVPVTISGSRSVLPVGAWRVAPGTIEIFVSKPVHVEHVRSGDIRQIALEIRRAIENNLSRSRPDDGPLSSAQSPIFVDRDSAENRSV